MGRWGLFYSAFHTNVALLPFAPFSHVWYLCASYACPRSHLASLSSHVVAKKASVRRAEAQMAVANQQMHDNKRLAVLRNSSLLVKISAADKKLVGIGIRIRITTAQDQVTCNNAQHELCSCSALIPVLSHPPFQLFRRRHECSKYPLLLPKFLQSVDWSKAWQVREAYRVLPLW